MWYVVSCWSMLVTHAQSHMWSRTLTPVGILATQAVSHSHTCGHTWPTLVTRVVTPGPLWSHLVHSGHTCGHTWSSLVTPGPLWSHLWSHLVIPGPFCYITPVSTPVPVDCTAGPFLPPCRVPVTAIRQLQSQGRRHGSHTCCGLRLGSCWISACPHHPASLRILTTSPGD